jgi:cyclic beta-1,2-glucan synthetase
MVIVPTMFDRPEQVRDFLAHLEVQALGNVDPHILFAVLSDFRDAESETLPQDEAVLEAAREGIDALNRKYAGAQSTRFFLFHRRRQWNPSESLWMGWERKRGKLEEFNRLLRGATDTSFAVQIGDLSLMPGVRYCITLDTDTRLPRDTAKQLIGVIIHPLNRAVFDARVGRVVEGYGILQPRISVTFTSAAGSLFARLYSGHTGVDPYTTAVSDTYQDLFGEGIFTGKGIYDVDAFTAALHDSVPVNALLSHDLFEGLHARVALVSDLELVDEYPASVLSHARRQHRWIRGDWQILYWLFPVVPSRRGWKRNTLPLISRWKILDNLRRSLVAPSLVALAVGGWTVLPGPRWFWTTLVITVLASQLLPIAARLLIGPQRSQSAQVFLANLRRDTLTSLAQVFPRRHLPGVSCVRFAARDSPSRWCGWRSRSGACSNGKRRPARPPVPPRSPARRRSGGSSPRWPPARSWPSSSPRRCRRASRRRCSRRRRSSCCGCWRRSSPTVSAYRSARASVRSATRSGGGCA